ncbi:MAG: NUDIX domain-containing protein [Peptococcaceae bacterium]|nr:NUDIX domain-containing protein [Peptococcaceae bacterium]
MLETAAGGVVFRRNNQQWQLLVIKDRYGKMALPKGKTEPGESPEMTALREIREETGVIGEIVAPLAIIKYQYIHPKRGLVDKEVTYFLVKALTEDLTPQVEEVESTAWVDEHEALTLGDYANNWPVLQKAIEVLNCQ